MNYFLPYEGKRGHLPAHFSLLMLKRSRVCLPLLLLLTMFLTTDTLAQVSGTVFRDLPLNGTTANTYGVHQTNEPGIANIEVIVTQSSGTSTTVTTDAAGDWSVPSATSFPVRVEFVNWPSYLFPSPENGNNNTSVQFITVTSTDVDFGLQDPKDYLDVDDVTYTVPTYTVGANTTATNDALFRFRPDQRGIVGVPTVDVLADASDMGSVLGSNSPWEIA